MKDKNILIDTSVWIDYFKGTNTALCKQVDAALNNFEVHVPRIVIAELIQGGKSEKEVSVIEDFISAFNIVDQQQNTWIDAGRLSFSLKKKGITVNLTDCYIASIAFENACRIFTLDKHFKDIKKMLKIELL